MTGLFLFFLPSVVERNEKMIIMLIRSKCYCCCGELRVMSIDELNLQGSSSSLGARDNPPSRTKTDVHPR